MDLNWIKLAQDRFQCRNLCVVCYVFLYKILSQNHSRYNYYMV